MDATPEAASRAVRSRALTVSLPFWVLVGAFLGIIAGITFGERASVLHPLGVVYAMMLESVVYPYILSSLIVGLGSLAGTRARALFRLDLGRIPGADRRVRVVCEYGGNDRAADGRHACGLYRPVFDR